jgi:alkylation response protein AidB-like acyl-CoA dehydrogenase
MSSLTQLTEDERLLQQSVREFSQAQIRPLVREMDEHAKFSPALLKQLFDLGVMGIEIPDAYGGGGGTFFHAVLVVEELSRVDPSVGVLVDVQNTLVINAVLRWASADLKSRLLPALARPPGRRLRAFRGLVRQRRVRPPDPRAPGRRRLCDSGRKLWITNANEADFFIVFATVNPDAGYRGITAFLVERGTPGFTVGKKEDKLGIRASSTCELIFEDCRVPAAHVIGEVGKGYKVAIETLNEGRIGIGAQMLGLAIGALDHAIRYTKERKQFGKAIADFQGVQFQLARVAMDIEAARLLVYNAARPPRPGPAVPDGSGYVQIVRVRSRRTIGVTRRQPLRRQRIREGLPGGKTLSGRQDRPNLRRHEQSATADDRQTDPRLTCQSTRRHGENTEARIIFG